MPYYFDSRIKNSCFTFTGTAGYSEVYNWYQALLIKEEPAINYKASLPPHYSAESIREKLRVAGVLSLVETFGFPLQKIAINVALPGNKRKKTFIVVYRDDQHLNAQLVLECFRNPLTPYQKERAIKKTITKARLICADWALVAVGEETVFVVNVKDPKNVVSLPLILK